MIIKAFGIRVKQYIIDWQQRRCEWILELVDSSFANNMLCVSANEGSLWALKTRVRDPSLIRETYALIKHVFCVKTIQFVRSIEGKTERREEREKKIIN